MSMKFTFDRYTNKEKLVNGDIQHYLCQHNDMMCSVVKAKEMCEVFYDDEFLFNASPVGLLKMRFHKRISKYPLLVEYNRYMNQKELDDLAMNCGYKNPNDFYTKITKKHGKELLKNLFLLIQFRR